MFNPSKQSIYLLREPFSSCTYVGKVGSWFAFYDSKAMVFFSKRRTYPLDLTTQCLTIGEYLFEFPNWKCFHK